MSGSRLPQVLVSRLQVAHRALAREAEITDCLGKGSELASWVRTLRGWNLLRPVQRESLDRIVFTCIWDSFGRLPLLECRKHPALCRGYVFRTLQHTPRILRGMHTAKLFGHVLQQRENAIAACGKARQQFLLLLQNCRRGLCRSEEHTSELQSPPHLLI